MTTATSTAEIRLYNAMVNNSLTIDEAIIAMEQFRDHLNVDNLIIQNEGVDNRAMIYDNDCTVLDEWDTWTD